jgi:hypothetical protein
MAQIASAEDLQGANEFGEVLGLEGKELKIRGKSFHIEPLQAKQFSDILKRIQSLREKGVVEFKIETGEELAEAIASSSAKEFVSKMRQRLRGFDVIKMLLQGGDEGLYILHHASGLPRDFVFNLDLVNLVRLAKEVVELNVDFFSRNMEVLEAILGPVWGRIQGFLQEFLKDHLPQPSPSSSETATASETSETTPSSSSSISPARRPRTKSSKS